MTRTFCVDGHHYALVIIDGLAPGSSHAVRGAPRRRGALAGPAAALPPSRIRTLDGGARCALRLRLVPHRRAARAAVVARARRRPARPGVDALYAHALRWSTCRRRSGRDLVVFLGDQVYADDSSPETASACEARREQDRRDERDLPAGPRRRVRGVHLALPRVVVAGVERWFLSVVPSVMIFDDHDMIDDWNISAAWVREIRESRGGRSTSSAG